MATITIPAAYLEDAQTALMSEIHGDGESLDGQPPIERATSTLILKRDMQLLEQLLDASSDAVLEAEDDQISHPILMTVETMIRRLIGRLDRESVYAPLPLAAMLPLVDELRWAMSEAVRLNPAEVA